MTNTAKRIGSQMRAALDYIARNPGCTKAAASDYIFPRSRQFGYRPVNRLIGRGLVKAVKRSGRYALQVVSCSS